MRRGYTLLEMAIVLTVVGIFIAAAITGYNIYTKKQAIVKTETNISLVARALNAYLIKQGRYPCPAPLNVGRDDPTYGFSIANNLCGDPLSAEGASAASAPTCGKDSDGDCVMYQGVYKLYGAPSMTQIPANDRQQRLVNIVPRSTTDCRNFVETSPGSGSWAPNGDAADCASPVAWHGAVPFRELALPEDVVVDGYGARLVFVVSENLTNAKTYRKDSGVISVVDEQNNMLVDPQGSAHFLILSHGRDQVGGYSVAGNVMRPCPDSFWATTDALNCPSAGDKGRGVSRNQTVFLNAGTIEEDNSVATASYRQARAGHAQDGQSMLRWFDDHVRFYSSNETPLWKVADADGQHIVDMPLGADGLSKVGVAFGDAQTPSVVGMDIKGVSGPSRLVSDDDIRAGQICDANGENCFLVDNVGGTGIRCDDGEFVSQIRGQDGQARVECTADITLSCPAGHLLMGITEDGVMQCEPVASCPAKEFNMCNTSAGWQRHAVTSGVQGQIYTTPIYGDSLKVTYRCNAGEWVEQSRSGVCSCTPVDQDLIEICDDIKPDGFWDGQTLARRTVVCPSGVETMTIINPSEEACTCRPGFQTRNPACATGFGSGEIKERRDWTCSADLMSGSWSDWYQTENTCSCTPGAIQRPQPCDPPLIGWEGTYQQTGTRNCPNAAGQPGTETWNPMPTNPVPSTCTCDSNKIREERSLCPMGQNGDIVYRSRLCCAGAASGYPECVGVPVGTYSPLALVRNTCGYTTTTWQDLGSSGQGGNQQTNNASLPKIGDPCTPPPGGGQRSCRSPQQSGNGIWDLVQCRCQ